MYTDKGRVAFISAASTFAPFGRAGHARREVQGRPGLRAHLHKRYCPGFKVQQRVLSPGGLEDRMFNRINIGLIFVHLLTQLAGDGGLSRPLFFHLAPDL